MVRGAYEYNYIAGWYTFISLGNKSIEKVVEFIPTGVPNIMSLSFGDLLEDGSIDYNVVSNNGDINKVLATVIEIVNHFTSQRPEVSIYFKGSTVERTKLYKRVLKMHYPVFCKSFLIWGLVKMGDNYYEEIPFHPQAAIIYFCFLIKRIN